MFLLKLARRALFALAGLLVLAQLVPYGRDHSNPPVLSEPLWDSARTRQLVADACFDCHSNRTRWPWYTNVAPASWLIQRDVDRGREELNFSRWRQSQPEVEEIFETVSEGEMPPRSYELIQGTARLSGSERSELLRGLRASLGR